MWQLCAAMMSRVGCLLTDFNATRYMKVKRMGITENLRRIWLFSANKIKSSESFCKQPTQLIIELDSSLRHIIVTNLSSAVGPCKWTSLQPILKLQIQIDSFQIGSVAVLVVEFRVWGYWSNLIRMSSFRVEIWYQILSGS